MEKKTYDWTYLFRLPYECAPFETVSVYVQKLLVGVACVLAIVVEAGLIDTFFAIYRGQGNVGKAYGYLFALLALIVCKRMGYAAGRRWSKRCQNRVNYQLRREIMKKCGRVSFRLLEDRTFQELKAYIEMQLLDRSIIWHSIQYLGNFLQGCLRILGVYLIVCTKNLPLGLLLLGVTVPILYFYARSARETEKAWSQQGNSLRQEAYLRGVLCGRDNLQERTLFSYTDYLDEQWRIRKELASGEELRNRGRNQSDAAGEETMFYLVLLLAVLFLISMLAKGSLSLGLFIALVIGLYEVINQTAHGINKNLLQTEWGILFLQKLTAFANLPEKEGMQEEPSEKGEPFESLVFSHVSFRYPGTARYVLRDLSFEMEKGRRYAFVGVNGSGKTTIAKLLTGLYDNYEGSILLNGKELKEYAQGEIKGMFGAIYQDSARYEETLADNILLGDIRSMEAASCAVREEMADCAARAGLEEMVQTLPLGYDTLLGSLTEESVNLSDGLWQRVFMARLLRNPAPVWIVDEPAAALDPVSESRLYEQFAELSRGRTTLSISHRLGSVKSADCIFVLQDGGILEQGTHEELMNHRALYAEMFENQKAWYG
ncbi:MAG: ABC transporter ATP-binding protein [Acetatifactor sp.]